MLLRQLKLGNIKKMFFFTIMVYTNDDPIIAKD